MHNRPKMNTVFTSKTDVNITFFSAFFTNGYDGKQGVDLIRELTEAFEKLNIMITSTMVYSSV